MAYRTVIYVIELPPHTYAPYTSWLHTTRAKLCQYEAKDFDVIANVPQKEHILKKMYFLGEASAVEMHTMQS